MLTDLLSSHQLGQWQEGGQAPGWQTVSYSVPQASLEAAWGLVRTKLAELHVLQQATVEVEEDEGPPRQLWPHRGPDLP